MMRQSAHRCVVAFAQAVERSGQPAGNQGWSRHSIERGWCKPGITKCCHGAPVFSNNSVLILFERWGESTILYLDVRSFEISRRKFSFTFRHLQPNLIYLARFTHKTKLWKCRYSKVHHPDGNTHASLLCWVKPITYYSATWGDNDYLLQNLF